MSIKTASQSDDELFLEQVAQGGTSGSYSDWSQLRPACRWALDTIETQAREVERLTLLVDTICLDAG